MSFSNLPPIYHWMDDEEKSFRKKSEQLIEDAINSGILPGDLIKTEFFNSGENSVVAKVTTTVQSYVVKLRRETGILESERVFFEEWQKQGVKVPKIIYCSPPSEAFPYAISALEYINAPLLSESRTMPEMINKKIFQELGEVLAKIHLSRGEGFGKPLVGNEKKGEFNSLSEEMNELLFETKVPILKSLGIIDQKNIEVAHLAVDLLEKDIQKGRNPSLIHNDFGPYNIFNTEPLTVFDPNPRVTHPAICLAILLARFIIDTTPRAIVQNEIEEERGQILAGYRNVTFLSDEIIAAGSILRYLEVLYHWNTKGKKIEIQKLLKLLKQNEAIFSA